MKAQTEIDEILQAVFTKAYNDAPGNPALPHLLLGKELTLAEAYAKLQRLINSIIGEDDTVLPMVSGVDYEAIFKNELRAEQRQRLSHIQEPSDDLDASGPGDVIPKGI